MDGRDISDGTRVSCVEPGVRVSRYLLLIGLMLVVAHAAGQEKIVLPQPQPTESALTKAAQLFALANEARAAAGVGSLAWDSALADAALKHCLRMAVEGPIAHRYDGEPDLTTRAGAAGAHFSYVEENIAVGSNPGAIHQGWLDSPEHRANLLNAEVDRVGIAVVASGDLIFAVADFERAVTVLTQTQVETAFAKLLRARLIMVMKDTNEARSYCASSGRYQGVNPPSFLFRWQNPDVTQLPVPLVEQLVTGRYHKAAVGNCPAQDVKGAFTIYRVAVLLY
jgi:cysteine-rich secretory family protein